MKSINPATGDLLRVYPEHTPSEVENRIFEAQGAFEVHRRLGFSERSAPMRKAAALLRQGQEEFARLMTIEMGKPIRQARAEVEKCAWVCEYFAENAGRFLSPEPVVTEASRSYVRFEPLGVILAIMPWNFPFWQVFRFAAPALMAGNAALLKHSSNVCGCALAIEELFSRAGFPNHLFQALLVPSGQVEVVLAHPNVAAVSLTGSGEAGRAVARAAGEQGKKIVLELGGSDPYLVLADADLDRAVAVCVESRLINNGESCIAAKRFIVVEELLDNFTARFLALMRSKKMGDPMEEATDLGPLARGDLREDLHRQVTQSVQAGAQLLAGGEIPKGRGFFYPATVLAGGPRDCPVFRQETFGPVALIVPVKDESAAVDVANDSPFGLGAAVFTCDAVRGESVAASLECGSIFINAAVKSDPRLPFGGVKSSGHGRELAAFGCREFCNVKTVWVA